MDAACRPEVSIDAQKNHNPDDAPPIRRLAGEPLTHLFWAPAPAATDLVMKDETD
jgi:hypothetical protein